jgi:hypothetical protein
MRYLLRLPIVLLLLLLLSCPSAALADTNGEFKQLFNGKDLTGWEGDPNIWRVEDGLITGQTTRDTKLQANTFLIWTGGEVDDFVLEAEFRLEGDNNSGIQYRSQRNPKKGKYSIIGYQGDIHPASNYIGMLYDEGGRGIAAERGQKVVLGPDDKKSVEQLTAPDKLEPVDLAKWNKLEITAQGNRLIHKINGEQTIDLTENDPQNAESKGLLALQVHAGPPMKVQFKSIKLKPLNKDVAAAKGGTP